MIFEISGNALNVRSLSRSRVRVCPACIREQAEAHHGLAPRWLPWKLLSLRGPVRSTACPFSTCRASATP